MPDPAHEPLLRLGLFLGVWLLLALAEWRWPRRREDMQRGPRWTVNFGLVLIDSLALRLLMPFLAVEAALLAGERGWGLFNLVEAPYWLAFLVSVVLLDLAIYWQHRIFHLVPWLWRLHRVHHSDLHLDASSGIRFHPVEILLSMLIKIALVAALGAPALAVLVFEILLNLFSLFTHANLALPARVDRVLRALVVTPDMHRVHHSILHGEQLRNFGFNLSVWDRLFRSYRFDAEAGQLGMTIGVNEFRDARRLGLGALLVQPFLARREEQGGQP
ncbi:MAG TPA: sterol desaturase family protein [Xanthomonadaceae bacterium]|nr:sterol desaturase family protein [Xanthomonadaceae bacterium]